MYTHKLSMDIKEVLDGKQAQLSFVSWQQTPQCEQTSFSRDICIVISNIPYKVYSGTNI